MQKSCAATMHNAIQWTSTLWVQVQSRSQNQLPSIATDNNNTQGNKPAATVGDDATLLKGASWSPDVLVEKETLLAFDGTFGWFLGELLDSNWTPSCLVNADGFCTCCNAGVSDFSLSAILSSGNITCFGTFGFSIRLHREKDALLNCARSCCTWGRLLRFCSVSLSRGRSAMSSPYTVLAMTLVNVSIVTCTNGNAEGVFFSDLCGTCCSPTDLNWWVWIQTLPGPKSCVLW